MRRLKSSHNRAAVQAALIAAGLIFVVLGIYREEVKTVLMKAIFICLECIGIG